MTPQQLQFYYWAQQHGLDPAYAMATAERESSFNPNAGGKGTIRGGYQMTRALRQQYGVPEQNASLEQQTKGFASYTKDLAADMKRRIGRDPTNAELYLGHHFGPYRASSMVNGRISPNTPVDQVFTPREMRDNPHFARAGTTGALSSSIQGDMHRRMGKYGAPRPPGDVPEASMASVPPQGGAPQDFFDFGEFNGQRIPGNELPGSSPKGGMMTDATTGAGLPAEAPLTPPAGAPAPQPSPAQQVQNRFPTPAETAAWAKPGETSLDKSWTEPAAPRKDPIGDLIRSMDQKPLGQRNSSLDFSDFGQPQTAALETKPNDVQDTTRAIRRDEMDIKRDRNEAPFDPNTLPSMPIPPAPGPTQIGLNPELFGAPDAMVA